MIGNVLSVLQKCEKTSIQISLNSDKYTVYFTYTYTCHIQMKFSLSKFITQMKHARSKCNATVKIYQNQNQNANA